MAKPEAKWKQEYREKLSHMSLRDLVEQACIARMQESRIWNTSSSDSWRAEYTQSALDKMLTEVEANLSRYAHSPVRCPKCGQGPL